MKQNTRFPRSAPSHSNGTFPKPCRVWRAFTDAEIVAEWLGPNDLRPE